MSAELLFLNVMLYKARLNKVFYVKEMAGGQSCHLRLSGAVGAAQGQPLRPGWAPTAAFMPSIISVGNLARLLATTSRRRAPL